MHLENLQPGDHVTVLSGEQRSMPLLGGSAQTALMAIGGDGVVVSSDCGMCAPPMLLSRDRSMEGAVLRVLGVNAPFVVVAVIGTSIVGPRRVLDTRLIDLSHLVNPQYIEAMLAIQEEQLKLHQAAQEAGQLVGSIAQQILQQRQSAPQADSTGSPQGGSDGQG